VNVTGAAPLFRASDGGAVPDLHGVKVPYVRKIPHTAGVRFGTLGPDL
jgi:hypothetical protein